MIVLQLITISKSIMLFFFQLCLKKCENHPYFVTVLPSHSHSPYLRSCLMFPFAILVLHFLLTCRPVYTSVGLHCSLSLPPSLLLSVSGCVHVKLHSLTSESSVRSPTGCLSVLQTPACVTSPSYLARQQEFSIDLVSL